MPTDPIYVLMTLVVIAILVIVFGSYIARLGADGTTVGARVLGVIGILAILVVVVYLLNGLGVF